MKTTRTKNAATTARRKPRFVKAEAPAAPAPPKQRRTPARPSRPVAPSPKPKKKVRAPRKKTTPDAAGGAALPGWGELKASRPARVAPAAPSALDGMPTTRFALVLVAIAAAFTLYVGHVHATQDLLAEVQQLRKENLQAHLRHNRLKGEYDRATGPAVIYRRARALGLVEDPAYGPAITLYR